MVVNDKISSMAFSSFVSSSGCLPNTALPLLSEGCSSAARSLSSREADQCMKACRAVPSLRFPEAAGRAPSRSRRNQAVEESSSSSAIAAVVTVTEEVKGGGGECPGCGKAEKLGGCNGEGRIQGGIGAVPGFGWWPIKAFRPCPAFIETGGRYRRIGQSLEEVAFGRKGAADDVDVSERLKG